MYTSRLPFCTTYIISIPRDARSYRAICVTLDRGALPYLCAVVKMYVPDFHQRKAAYTYNTFTYLCIINMML